MTGIAYATSAEMAKELGSFPRYAENADSMLRVVRNHRRAAHGEELGYEFLQTNPVPLDRTHCPQPDLVQHAAGLRQVTRRDGEPRDEADLVLLAVLEHVLTLAVADVVLVLDADDLDRLLRTLDLFYFHF